MQLKRNTSKYPSNKIPFQKGETSMCYHPFPQNYLST